MAGRSSTFASPLSALGASHGARPTRGELQELQEIYRTTLLDDCLPFWDPLLDEEHGGLFTCVDDYGKMCVRAARLLSGEYGRQRPVSGTLRYGGGQRVQGFSRPSSIVAAQLGLAFIEPPLKPDTCEWCAPARASTDKWMWSQFRAVWVYSRLANDAALLCPPGTPRAEVAAKAGDWLRRARVILDFCLRHGWDAEEGAWRLTLSGDGRRVVRGCESVYADVFASTWPARGNGTGASKRN